MEDKQQIQNQPCAFYGRVSTEEQKKGETINSQIDELKKKMAEDGNFLWHEERGIYKDEGYSGSLLARPDLDRLRDDAKSGCCKVVYILEPDRLARENHYIGLVVSELKNLGIKVIFKNTPLRDGPTGDLMLNIYGSFAQYENAVRTERTRRGRRYKAKEKKLIVGNIPPFGFRYVKKDKEKDIEGYYEINEEEIKVVKEMFRLVDEEHYSARQLVRRLTENKISPRKDGKKWAKSSVLRILHREEYIGIAYYNKYESVEPKNPRSNRKYHKRKKTGRRLRPKNEWIPIPLSFSEIIPKDRFLHVQQIIDESRVFSKRNTKYEYLFSGLIRSTDSTLYAGTPFHGVPYYRYSRDRAFPFPVPKNINPKSIKAQYLDSAGWQAILKAIQNPDLILSHISKLKECCEKNYSGVDEDIKSSNRKIENIKEEEERIWEAYKAKVITLSKLREEREQIEKRRKDCQKEIQELSRRKTETIPHHLTKESIEYFCNKIRERLKEMEKNFEEKQKFVRLLVNKGVLIDRMLKLECEIPLKTVDIGNIIS